MMQNVVKNFYYLVIATYTKSIVNPVMLEPTENIRFYYSNRYHGFDKRICIF